MEEKKELRNLKENKPPTTLECLKEAITKEMKVITHNINKKEILTTRQLRTTLGKLNSDK